MRGMLAVVAVTLAFAPIIGGGWCGDAGDGGTSVCVLYQRSVIGIDTSVWIWAGALLIVTTRTGVAFIRARRGRTIE